MINKTRSWSSDLISSPLSYYYCCCLYPIGTRRFSLLSRLITALSQRVCSRPGSRCNSMASLSTNFNRRNTSSSAVSLRHCSRPSSSGCSSGSSLTLDNFSHHHQADQSAAVRSKSTSSLCHSSHTRSSRSVSLTSLSATKADIPDQGQGIMRRSMSRSTFKQLTSSLEEVNEDHEEHEEGEQYVFIPNEDIDWSTMYF